MSPIFIVFFLLCKLLLDQSIHFTAIFFLLLALIFLSCSSLSSLPLFFQHCNLCSFSIFISFLSLFHLSVVIISTRVRTSYSVFGAGCLSTTIAASSSPQSLLLLLATCTWPALSRTRHRTPFTNCISHLLKSGQVLVIIHRFRLR